MLLIALQSSLDRLLLIPSADIRPGVRGSQSVAAINAAVAAGVKHIILISATGTREQAEPAIGAPYFEPPGSNRRAPGASPRGSPPNVRFGPEACWAELPGS
jgi:hypothetical protein